MADELNGADQMIIRDPDTLVAKMIEWKSRGYHVLSPLTRIQAFPSGYGVNVTQIFLDSPEDSYFAARMKEGERALSKIGLMKISLAAAVSWLSSLSVRTDDRRIQFLWEYRAAAAVLDYDGTPSTFHATAEVDLRDGSAQIGYWTPDDWKALLAHNETAKKNEPTVKGLKWDLNGWTEARVREQRAFGLRLAESKAMEAAVRQRFGIKNVYAVEELRLPFIVLRVAYIPDLRDPVMRQMTAERGLAGIAALFASASAPALGPGRPADTIVDLVGFREDREREPVSVGRGQSEAAKQAAAAPVPAPQAPAPPAATNAPAQAAPGAATAHPGPAVAPVREGGQMVGDGVFVVDVKRTNSIGENERGPWRLHFVKFSTGDEVACFADAIVRLAEQFKADHTACEPTIERKGTRTQLVALEKLGAQPGIPGLGAVNFPL